MHKINAILLRRHLGCHTGDWNWGRRWPAALRCWKEGAAGLRSFRGGLGRWWCCGFVSGMVGRWCHCELCLPAAMAGRRHNFVLEGGSAPFIGMLGFVVKLATSGGG